MSEFDLWGGLSVSDIPDLTATLQPNITCLDDLLQYVAERGCTPEQMEEEIMRPVWNAENEALLEAQHLSD